MARNPFSLASIAVTFCLPHLNALKAHASFSGLIDHTSCDLFLRFGYVPAPYTIYKDTYKLKSSSKLTISLDPSTTRLPDPEIKSYCDPLSYRHSESPADCSLQSIKNSLVTSVSQCLQSDVPVGVLLSSGVDSTLIASIAQTESCNQLDAFTIRFSDQQFDESLAASTNAHKLGINHHVFQLNDNDCLGLIAKLPEVYGEPFVDPSALPSLVVSKLVSESVKVCLSGDGADELFAGYSRYNNPKPLNFWNSWNSLLPSLLRFPLSSFVNFLNHHPLLTHSTFASHQLTGRIASFY